MTKQSAEDLRDGYELLGQWARMIAMLPLEEWLHALNMVDTIAPILDPTAYREFLHSEKPDIIKSLIRAAIPLKRAVLDAQPACVREMEKEASARARTRLLVTSPAEASANEKENPE